MDKTTRDLKWGYQLPAGKQYELYRKNAGAIAKWLLENEEFEITKRLAVFHRSAFVRLHRVIHKILAANSCSKESANVS